MRSSRVPPHSEPVGLARLLPEAVVATAVVTVLPGVVVLALMPAGSPALLLLAPLLAAACSVGAASVAAAMWTRRRSPGVVFADLMLWGLVRRLRAERRLSKIDKLLPATPAGASFETRVRRLSRMSRLLEARDRTTYGHSRRVTRHAERIAQALHLPSGDVARIRTAAALHDIGKLHTPRTVLDKAGRLTDAEFALIKRHPGDGAAMVAALGDPQITAMVRHHHERLDGSGYPDGRAGADIPLGARIIAVADTFDAITSTRAYRRAGSHQRALDVLAGEAGVKLDADAVRAFRAYYAARRPVALSALLTAGPARLASWLGSTGEGLGAGSGTLAQAVAAAGAAAVIAVPATTPALRGDGGGRAIAASHEARGAHAAPPPGWRRAATAPASSRPSVAGASATRARARRPDRRPRRGRPDAHVGPDTEPATAAVQGAPAGARPALGEPRTPRREAPPVELPAAPIDVPDAVADPVAGVVEAAAPVSDPVAGVVDAATHAVPAAPVDPAPVDEALGETAPLLPPG
jgi:putative nucleotidyltransferase with HDIG domain